MGTPTNRIVTIRYAVDEPPASWTLEDEKVPESNPHLLTCDLLYQLLSAWVARTGRDALVGKDIAVRWDERHKNVGFDPDVYVVEPRPPEGDDVESLLLWRPGHMPPTLAIEVVSPDNARKDYFATPEKCAAAGIGELWVFDRHVAGPRARGPVRLQLWRRGEDGFERVYAGEGPALSTYLDAWVFVTDEGTRVRIADDREGTKWWMTESEAARTEAEAALARVRELEAELQRRDG